MQYKITMTLICQEHKIKQQKKMYNSRYILFPSKIV